MKRLLLILLTLALMPLGIAGALTVTEGGHTIQLTSIDADFTYSASCMLYGNDGRGRRVNYILFVPSETNETLSIKEGSDIGPEILYVTANNSDDQKIVYFNGAKLRPVLDYSASSLTTGAKVTIQLWPYR